jgi:hypothetical protein
MVLEDIGLYLQTNGLGTLGQTIFLGMLPLDQPGGGVQDAVLGLFEVPGLPPTHSHDAAGPRYEQPMVQLRFRGTPYGYQAARMQAGEAFTLLDSVVNQTINGTRYLWMQAMQSPFGQPADEWNRPFVVFEVRCARHAA